MRDAMHTLETQWDELVHDPQGPRHYCDSRFDATKHRNLDYHVKDMRPILRLLTNNSMVEMDVVDGTLVRGQYEVPRCADILVGVILRGPEARADLDLEIMARCVCRLTLFQDEPTLVLGGDNVLPLLGMCFSSVRLRSEEAVTLDLIYAYLDSPVRNELVCDSLSLEFNGGQSWLHIDRGMAYVHPQPRYRKIELLRSYSWRQDMERQRQRTKRYEEELVRVAWHPSRFQEWCLDMTE
jgi:hypothetical protein